MHLNYKISDTKLKYVSLCTLIVQNSMLVLVMRYSRTLGGPQYVASTAVVMSEAIKFAVSLFVHWKTGHLESATDLAVQLFGKDSNWLSMMVPAALYFIQNNLQYVAVSHLDAATFQVTYQMKILTTALFSVWILKRSLGLQKWIALVILAFGIGLVQVSSIANGAAAPEVDSKIVGLLAVMIACLLSGLAGVW